MVANVLVRSFYPDPDDGFTIKAACGTVPVVTSFPIAPTIQGALSSRNPYFAFTVPERSGAFQAQWQIHPTEHGVGRYSLVRLNSTASCSPTVENSVPKDGDYDRDILAIYHNIGIGLSLSQGHTEGVLLLPENNDPALEALVVASLLGLLRQIRAMPEAMKKTKVMVRGKPLLKSITSFTRPRWTLSNKSRYLC